MFVKLRKLANASGVGPDPREDRYFNVIKQATFYDPDCDFIRLWIPELSVLSNEEYCII